MCWCNLIWFFVLNGPCLRQKTTFFEQQRHLAALDLFDIWILNQMSQSAHIWLNFLRNSFWQWFNVWVPLELSFESLKTLWLFPDYHIKLADVYHPRKDFLPIKLSSKKSIELMIIVFLKDLTFLSLSSQLQPYAFSRAPWFSFIPQLQLVSQGMNPLFQF